MGSFYFINTFMRTFKLLNEVLLKKQKVTNLTAAAQQKFGSNNTLKKIGKGAPKGHQSLPGLKNKRPQ
jgi:hypothetical protein